MPVEFNHLQDAINSGIERQLHTGVQAYVSMRGEVLLDCGFGEAAPGVDLTSATIMLWRSAGKPLTAVAILQLVESGLLSLDTKVAEVLTDGQGTFAGEATLKQILTHTSGIPITATGWPAASTNEILRAAFDFHTGATDEAAYQPQTTWFLLGEILRQTTQSSSFQHVLQKHILEPLELTDVWCGISPQIADQLRDRLPVIYDRDKGQLVPSDYSDGAWLAQPSPGGNLRGPISGLGRFYEMLMRGGVAANGSRIISEQAIQQMTARHRINQFDTTLQHVVDFGLGVVVNSNQYGEATVPYGFGRFSSPNAFGHGGSQCSIGFCDPQHQLVVAWAANAFCGEGQHQRRNRAINEAIYQDLGLAQ